MLKTIIAKELLNNILNLRFMFSLVFCIILTFACIMILTHDYRQESVDYSIRINMQNELLSSYATEEHFWKMGRPQKPPERFRLLIVGIKDDPQKESAYDSPLPILFPPIDFLFIVTIIMSLLAILFSYDAVTGERQSGTLRLVVANSVPRIKILLGKLIGGVASLLIPFVLSLMVAGLFVSIHPAIQWDGSAWVEFLLLAAASSMFITLFYILGLMVSTFSRYSATSILNCLFIWVLFILIIPNVCPYISAQLYRVPSITEIHRQASEIDRAAGEMCSKLTKEIVTQFRHDYGALFSRLESIAPSMLRQRGIADQKKVKELAAADPEFKAMVDAFGDEIQNAWDERKRMKEVEWKLLDDFDRRTAFQTKLAKNLACISPLTDFMYFARDLTSTGLRSLDYFERSKNQHIRVLNSYIDRKYKNAIDEDPEVDNYSVLDVDDRPRFIFKEEPLKGKLNAALPYWGILVLFNVVFFAAAFAGFMRYDVR
ncbi:ABC transporter permease subunit [Planctomycetota bacterium]